MGFAAPLALGIGSLLTGGASIYGASQQARAARSAEEQNRRQQANLQSLLLPRLGSVNTQDIEGLIQSLISQGQTVGSPITNAAVDLGQLPEIPGVTIAGNQAYNVGQDALMQLLRSDPSRQRSAADTAMTSMVATGQPFNTSDYFQSLLPVEARALDDAVARIGGASGSLGQRFGSATARQTQDAVSQLVEQSNLRRQELGRQSYESALGRQLSAAGLINQAEAQRAQTALGGIDAARGFAGLDLSAQQSNQGAALSEAQLIAQILGQNAASQNQTNQFNANLGLQGRSQQAALIQSLLGARGAGSQYDLGILSLLAGQPMAQPSQAAGMVPGAIAETGSMISMLPFLLQLMRGGGSAPATQAGG